MYIGIDIGGTNIKYGVIDDNGQIVSHHSCPTPQERDAFLSTLEQIITTQTHDGVKAVGISIPGIVEDGGYLKTAGAIQSLYRTHLKADIQRYCNLPIWIENDANCAAIAEKWVGNAVEASNYFCITVGTGIGGGIILNNELYRGGHGWAGEFGWMVAEHIADEANIENLSHNFTGAVGLGLHRSYHDKTGHREQLSAKDIIAREHEDAVAGEVVQTFYQSLAKLIINSVSILDPHVVLIGGAISEDATFMSRLKATIADLIARHRGLSSVTQPTDAMIRPCKLGNHAGMIGAAYLARKVLADKESE